MTRPMVMYMLLVCCAVAAALLCGCGGGGEQDAAADAGIATTQPVNCAATPKACI